MAIDDRTISPLAMPVGKEQLAKADQILLRYKQGKANLERRIVENEQWYKVRHWACMRKSKEDAVQPASAWLFNAIANKHADAMDNFPSANILPREEGDKAEAEMLSDIIPVVLDQCGFEGVYSDVVSYKLKTGTGVYGIFWDKSKLNGLGDIAIRKVDLLNLFWESGITDIQHSRNLFHVDLVDNDVLVNAYPQLAGKLGGNTMTVAEYLYDDTIDTTDKSVVVDWYYRRNVGGKNILHYCKYVQGQDEPLFATENDPMFAGRGWYDHGLYPFVFDPLYKTEGTPTGFGFIDIGKDTQEYIDRLNQVIVKNALWNARPRFFVRSDGAINENEYADLTKDLVHVDGNLGQDSVYPITGRDLGSIYVSVMQDKVNELKEVTGNRDVSTGGTTSGVTAASGIAAMQEAGSKLSRDNNKASYRAFRDVVLMVIELIRQFYDVPRCFRIMGASGMARFVSYSNQGIIPQVQGMEFGVDMGYRLPVFDVEVSAQKQSPYSKMAQNELALQFYSAGLFNPLMANQALLCLDMMDFNGKEQLMGKIAEAAASMAGQTISAVQGQRMPGGANGAEEQAEKNDNLGGDSERAGESAITAKARAEAAERTAPV